MASFGLLVLLVTSFASAAASRELIDHNLFIAIQDCKMDQVQSLLAQGANVNARLPRRKSHGATALMRAAENGCLDIVRLLIARGADVNARDDDGRTPLMAAADADAAKILLEHKANIDAKDDGGETALIDAASNGNLDAVRFLVDHGADMKIKDREGLTAASSACLVWIHGKSNPCPKKAILEALSRAR